MISRSCIVGLDLGTTSIKAVAFTSDEQIIGIAHAVVTTIHDSSDSSEQDPGEIWHATVTVLQMISQQTRAAGYTIGQIGISAAMHSLIAVADDGTPLTRAIIWMDSRAQSDARDLWKSEVGRAIYTRTGTPIHAMSPLAKLLWLQRTQPELMKRARRFISLKEWIWFHLSGNWQIDASLASATGLYQLLSGHWDEDALNLVGISNTQLSEIVPTTYTRQGLGKKLAIDGISDSTYWTIGASDGVLANLGVGAIDHHDLVITIGTSSAIRIGSPIPVTDVTTLIFCYILDAGRFIIGAPSNNGGVILEWVAKNLVGDLMVEPLIDAAAHTSGREILFLPYIAGERAPLWNLEVSGTIAGLKLHHTASDIMRGAIEGMLLNVRWMSEGLPEKAHRIIASGKVLEPAWIRALLADIFGIPVVFTQAGEASAKGAARLAMIATGQLNWDAILPDAPIETMEPHEHSAWEQHYHYFRDVAHQFYGAQ
jgi:gluconokinase